MKRMILAVAGLVLVLTATAARAGDSPVADKMVQIRAQMNQVKLMNRTDQKFWFHVDDLQDLLQAVSDDYYMLHIALLDPKVRPEIEKKFIEKSSNRAFYRTWRSALVNFRWSDGEQYLRNYTFDTSVT